MSLWFWALAAFVVALVILARLLAQAWLAPERRVVLVTQLEDCRHCLGFQYFGGCSVEGRIRLVDFT